MPDGWIIKAPSTSEGFVHTVRVIIVTSDGEYEEHSFCREWPNAFDRPVVDDDDMSLINKRLQHFSLPERYRKG